MALFLGDKTSSVDNKGRLAIPAVMRDQLASLGDKTLVLTISEDPCMVVFPVDVFEKESEKYEANLDLLDEKSRQFLRNRTTMAVVATLDGQGRIRIPESMMKDFGIKKSVRVLGCRRYMELWDPDTKEAHDQKFADHSSLSREMKGLRLNGGNA